VFLTDSAGYARKDGKLSEEKRTEMANVYGSQAVHVLREAANRGLLVLSQIKTAIEYAPLRQREDYKKLVEALEEKAKKEGK
jgi:hypothetical protein